MPGGLSDTIMSFTCKSESFVTILIRYGIAPVFSSITQAPMGYVRSANFGRYTTLNRTPHKWNKFLGMQSISIFENKLTKMTTRSFHMASLTDIRGTTALETMKKQYYTGSYASDHWALQPYELKDPKVIGIANYRGSEYAIYTNPTDKRGYRCIVRFISNKDMKSTINRDYTAQEQRGLSLVVELVESAFRQVVPVVQTFKAGNNSHKFDSEARITYIGKAEEPSFLRTHVIGRGDPEAEYIEDIQLDGPIPGLNFDMMGKTISEPGNDKKVKWKDIDMIKAVNCLKIEIEKSKREYEELGLVVITA